MRYRPGLIVTCQQTFRFLNCESGVDERRRPVVVQVHEAFQCAPVHFVAGGECAGPTFKPCLPPWKHDALRTVRAIRIAWVMRLRDKLQGFPSAGQAVVLVRGKVWSVAPRLFAGAESRLESRTIHMKARGAGTARHPTACDGPQSARISWISTADITVDAREPQFRHGLIRSGGGTAPAVLPK